MCLMARTVQMVVAQEHTRGQLELVRVQWLCMPWLDYGRFYEALLEERGHFLKAEESCSVLDPRVAGESVPFVFTGIALLLLSASHLHFRSDAYGRQTCMGVV